MRLTHKLSPCLWFDSQAEEAAMFYVSIFKNSKINKVTRYPEAGKEAHRRLPGSVMTVEFEIEGQPFTALNGGPVFTLNEAISFQVNCETQKEIDYYWEKLTPGGDPKAQQCGWVKDKFGVSWQVVPTMLPDLFVDHKSERAARAMEAMLTMKKIQIDQLERAVAAVS
jgi:predicted 3-demethylubiquinone-9 3-methyltransferase (glyoxalase superfamily)